MGLRDLNVDLTKEHVALWDSTKKFMREVWRPAAVALDRMQNPEDVYAEGSVLWDVFRKTNELGYHQMMFPQELGGMDADVMSTALFWELAGWAAPDLGISWGLHTSPVMWAMMSPDPEMQARFPEYPVILEQLECANENWRPLIPEWGEINAQIMGEQLGAFLNGTIDAETALATAKEQITDVMARAGYYGWNQR